MAKPDGQAAPRNGEEEEEVAELLVDKSERQLDAFLGQCFSINFDMWINKEIQWWARLRGYQVQVSTY